MGPLTRLYSTTYINLKSVYKFHHLNKLVQDVKEDELN
jgi:hypothetical protein